jgi:hypothetical protein
MGEERLEYLEEMEKWTHKDYLIHYRLSRKEWEAETVAELKHKIKEG